MTKNLAGSPENEPCNKVEALSKTHKSLGKSLYENIQKSEMGSYLNFLVTPDKNITRIRRKRKNRKRVRRDQGEVDLGKFIKLFISLTSQI